MSRPNRLVSLSALLALALATRGSAQSADTKPAEAGVFHDPAKVEAAADAPAPAPVKPKRPKRDRVMSDELAATLAVGMPQYEPPKPVEKKTPEPPSDSSEADKPKNGIVRLPDYVVREARPPVFKERELAGSDRKADLAMKRNPGLNFGPFASLNRPIALAMYHEQERLDGMAELADDARTAQRSGDKDTAAFIKKQSQETYLRRDDSFQSFGLGPK